MIPTLLSLAVAMPLLLSWSSSAIARSSSAALFCATKCSVDAAARSWRRRRADDAVVRRGKIITTTTTDDREGDEAPAVSIGHVYTVLDDDHRDGTDAGGVDDDDLRASLRRRRRRDMQLVLRTMERAAYLAGEVALSTSGKIDVRSTKANSRDLVTRSDLECQRLVREVVATEFPNDVFLGEEDIDDLRRWDDGDDGDACVGSGSSDSSIVNSDALKKSLDIVGGIGDEDRLLFIVDPIDGTTNFQAGLPVYAVSIGAVSLSGGKPEVVAGVIYNPALGEITSAVRGRGCYLNNKRIGIVKGGDRRPVKSLLGESLVNVGFPVCQESALLASSRAVTALATRVRGLRMVACASQAMAWVAQRKFGSYISWDLNAWDVAAGMVIIEEAGGSVSNFDGTRADITSRDIIMTCRPERSGEESRLRDEILEVLRDSDCLRY